MNTQKAAAAGIEQAGMENFSMTICSRCGAEIKNVFRVGELVFGSDCILKINEAEFNRVYFGGENLPLSVALIAFIKRRKREKELQVNPSAVPEIGAKVTQGEEKRTVYEVVGYTERGIRVKTFYQKYGWCFSDVRFDRASELEVLR